MYKKTFLKLCKKAVAFSAFSQKNTSIIAKKRSRRFICGASARFSIVYVYAEICGYTQVMDPSLTPCTYSNSSVKFEVIFFSFFLHQDDKPLLCEEIRERSGI